MGKLNLVFVPVFLAAYQFSDYCEMVLSTRFMLVAIGWKSSCTRPWFKFWQNITFTIC